MDISKKRIFNILQTYGLFYAIRRTLIHPFIVLKMSKYTYFFDKERILMKKFEKKINGIKNERNIEKIGNYYLDGSLINKNSIIYSFGVGVNIEFDLNLSNKKKCDIYLYDPTPKSIRFMKQFKSNKKLHYFPIGVWEKNQKIDFYFDSDYKKEADSASILNLGKNKKKFTAQCNTVKTIMENNKHKNIDLIKVDIEGAGLPVIKNMIKKDILPTQIVGEFERPRNDINKVKKFLKEIEILIKELESKGYEIYKLPRDLFPYYSIELLFVKKK